MRDTIVQKIRSLTKILTGNRRKWVEMRVDRLYFEQQTDRYFLLLKAAGKQNGETVSITIGNALDETILPGLFAKNDVTRAILDKLGLKISRIRILRKINSPDSAECLVRNGIFSKKIRLSTVEAIRMASEYRTTIEVPGEIIRADKFDLIDKTESFDAIHGNVYSFKFLDKDFQNNQEVIM